MEYNEKVFGKNANVKAMWMWLAMNLVLSVAYAIEILKSAKIRKIALMGMAENTLLNES